MGSLTILLSFVVVSMAISYAESAGSCPLPSKVYGCSPKCVQNYDCKNGKICCSNSCNAKSCSEPAPYGNSGATGSNKYSGTGTGTYCDNVKCNAYEVCKMDPATKRMKCSRP
ncbi:hypothetical protein K1T71_012979 [Dendrolimus kikuchii]|uniref:Uncharacterized protein n=1 Tax=Dendrolimus kikuchii TaxID=765133 RepID=A0ACC1CJ03_9NEOP|nr:hypothetical protein K1T71_012979 [Dendrolimus kikuchii]